MKTSRRGVIISVLILVLAGCAWLFAPLFPYYGSGYAGTLLKEIDSGQFASRDWKVSRARKLLGMRNADYFDIIATSKLDQRGLHIYFLPATLRLGPPITGVFIVGGKQQSNVGPTLSIEGESYPVRWASYSTEQKRFSSAGSSRLNLDDLPLSDNELLLPMSTLSSSGADLDKLKSGEAFLVVADVLNRHLQHKRWWREFD